MQRVLQEIMKKKIFETWDAWSKSCLSQQPSDPAYHIEDCRILAYTGSAMAKTILEIASKSWDFENFCTTTRDIV